VSTTTKNIKRAELEPPPLVKRNMSGNHAISLRRMGTEIVLVDPPYRITQPAIFADSVLSVDRDQQRCCHLTATGKKLSNSIVRPCRASILNNTNDGYYDVETMPLDGLVAQRRSKNAPPAFLLTLRARTIRLQAIYLGYMYIGGCGQSISCHLNPADHEARSKP
jgi:hypothetical protein